MPPNSPERNGYVGRANGASCSEFCNYYQGSLTIVPVNRELAGFQRRYDHYRPHDVLGLETPMNYYRRLMQAA